MTPQGIVQKLATTSSGNAYGPCIQYACVGMYRTSSVVIFMNGHFLRPTTSAKSISWVSTIILGENNLVPSKVGQTENFQTCLMDYSVLYTFRERPVAFGGDIREMFHQVKIMEKDTPAQRFLWRDMACSSPPEALSDGGDDFRSSFLAVFGTICQESERPTVRRHPARSSWCYIEEALHGRLPRQRRHETRGNQASQGSYSHPWARWFRDAELDLKFPPSSASNPGTSSGERRHRPQQRHRSANKANTGSPMESQRLFRLCAQSSYAQGSRWGDLDDKTPPAQNDHVCVWPHWLSRLFHGLGENDFARRLARRNWLGRRAACNSAGRSGPTGALQNFFKWRKSRSRVATLAVKNRRAMWNCMCSWMPVRRHPQPLLTCEPAVPPMSTQRRLFRLEPEFLPWSRYRSRGWSCKPRSWGSRLANTVKQEHDLPIKRTVFWSDSMTVLLWIRSDAHHYRPFVAHRIGEICKHTDPDAWKWVPNKDNPADLATRGARVGVLAPYSHSSRVRRSSPRTNAIGRRRVHQHQTRQQKQRAPLLKWRSCSSVRRLRTPLSRVHTSGLPDCKRFSSFTRLVRATTWVLRFVQVLRSCVRKQPVTFRQLTADELAKSARCSVPRRSRSPRRRCWTMDRLSAQEVVLFNCIPFSMMEAWSEPRDVCSKLKHSVRKRDSPSFSTTVTHSQL